MKHNWQYKKLGEICEILMGQSPSSESYNTKANGLPFFQGCADFGIINPEVTKYCSKPIRIADENDILFSVRAPIGSMNIANLQCCIGLGLCSLRICKPNLQQYLFYALTVTKSKIIEKGTGSTFKAVGKDVLFKHCIPLPPLEEQQRIVAELDRINAVMEDCRQLLHTLDTLAQSLFYDSFGDPISNPKAWPTQPLKEVAPASSSKAEPEESNGKFWLLNLDQIESNTGRIIEKQFFSIEEIGASTVLFDENNVLYSKLRPYLNKVVIPNGRGYCTSELIPLKPTKLLKEYLAYSLRLPEFVQYISGKTGGAKMPRVKMNYFWDFQLPLPPLELQQQFARRIEAIEAQKKAVEKNIATLQTLLDSRMDYWFN